jgi:hypothetical protein
MIFLWKKYLWKLLPNKFLASQAFRGYPLKVLSYQGIALSKYTPIDYMCPTSEQSKFALP